ncbi:uncharacterized protein LOC124146132 isoform X2 [Haliotis rufescens]|uniref:uncharacterized protein LOC124146132 isoform X2 n=1 Tax=Haliotis rufescens TaxID=6454 RepID=UPI00201F9C35|nr:uncharacterized protein LOC124146132 isoform X2 [Haliotis rufescens]
MTNGAVIESTFLTNSFYSGTGYRNRRVLTNVTSSYQSQRKTAKMLECVFNLWPESLITQAIIVGITAGFITYHIFKKRPALPPGPRGWPFIGNLREIQKGDPLELFSTWIEKYGPVITVKFGTWKVVILGRIDVVMEALVQKQEAFAGRPQTYSGDAFTAGSKDIVNGQYGPRWKLHRKLASKALRQYMTSDNLPRKISQSLNISTALMLEEHGPIDPLPFISLAVFNILYGMCFDKLCADTKDETFTFLMDSLKGLVENFGSGFLEDFIPLLRYCPTAKFRRQLKYIAALTEHIKKEMEEHKETFVYGQSRDFADAMLAAQKEAIDEEDPALLSQITDTHVVQTMGDVFFAGIDTTRNTLHWCLLVMALNPDIQKKVQEEVDSVIGRDLNVSLSDRSRLPYTEAVLHETMRIRGIAPMGIPHETLYDTSVGKKVYDTSVGKKVCDTSVGKKVCDTSVGKKVYDTSVGKKVYDTSVGKKVYDTSVGKKVYDTSVGKKFYDTSVGKKVYDTSFGKKVYDTSVGKKVYDTSVGKKVYDTSVGKKVCDTSVGKKVYDTSVGKKVYDTSVGKKVCDTSVGKKVYHPSVGKKVYDTSVGKKVYDTSVGKKVCDTSVGKKVYDPSVGKKVYHPSVGKKVYDTSVGKKVYDTSVGEKFYDTSVGKKVYDTSFGKKVYDTSFGKKVYDTSVGKKVYDTSVGKKVYDTSVGKKVYDTSVGKKVCDTSVGKKVYDTSVGKKVCDTSVGKKVYDTSVGKKVYDTSVGKKVYDTSVGKKVYDTSVGKKVYDTSVGKKVYDTSVGKKVYDTSVGKKDYDTSVGKKVYDTSVGKKVYDTSVGKKVYDTSVGKKVYDTSVGKKVYDTSVGKKVYDTSVGKKVYDTSVGKKVYDTSVGKKVYDTSVGKKFYDTSVGKKVYDTSFGKKVYDTSVGKKVYDTSVGGYELPKGTGVMIFHQGLHFDPDQWDNVNEFRPERFLDASGKMAPKPKSWLPFSAGRRVCLGEIIARPDLHLVLAGMMRACSVSLAPGETNDFKPAIPGFACLPRSYKVVVESRS